MVDFVTNFLISIHPFYAVTIVSIVASLIITVAYKFLTNQKRMKELKDQQKEFQKKMRESQKSNDTKKLMEIQQEAMAVNMEYMRSTMKPTLITMIPLLLIFGWLGSYCAYEQIMPGEEFSVYAIFEKSIGNATLEVPNGLSLISNETQDISLKILSDDEKKEIIDSNSRYLPKIKKNTNEYNMIVWRINADEEGRYNLVFKHEENTYTKTVRISEIRLYENPVLSIGENGAYGLVISNKPIYFFGLKWFTWIWLYILNSVIFGSIIRKIMKVS